MKTPIYRAKMVGSDEYVKGYLFKDTGSIQNGEYANKTIYLLTGYFDDNVDGWVPVKVEINSSTSEISLDGKNWKSMKDLEEMFIFDNEMMKIEIDTGRSIK